MTLSLARLAEAEKVIARLSSHEWSLTENSSGGMTLRRGHEGLPLRERHIQSHLQILPRADAEFIALSRTLLPDLIALVQALGTLREHMRQEEIEAARRGGPNAVVWSDAMRFIGEKLDALIPKGE